MELNEYQKLAGSTAIYPREPKPMNILYPTLGLCGEAGEVAEKVKKLIRDQKGQITEEFENDISYELGDVLWYLSQLASELGMSLESVAQWNLNKLSKRSERNKIHGSGDHR